MAAGSKGIGRSPKRIVGAYITDVEVSEETQLAAADAKAQESTSVVVSPDEPASARCCPIIPIETAEAPADMFRATEGRWGSREVEITDVLLAADDGERGHVFHSGEPLDDPDPAARRRSRSTTSWSGIGIFNAEGVCCYGTNTSLEELTGRADPRRRRGGRSPSRASIWSRAPTSSTSPSTSSTAIPTTTTACSTRSA